MGPDNENKTFYSDIKSNEKGKTQSSQLLYNKELRSSVK